MTDHLSTITKIYDAFGRGDLPTILDCLAADVAWEAWADNWAQARGVPWLRSRQGKTGAAEFFQYVGAQMKILEFSVLSVMAGGNQVAVEFVIEAEIPSTGGRYRDEEMHLWTLNDQGMVTRLRHYGDTAKHIHAAGLS